MSQAENTNWEIVYSSDKEYKIMIIKDLLDDHGIKSYEINKKDSSYLFGVFELYVKRDDVMKSKLIIEKSEL